MHDTEAPMVCKKSRTCKWVCFMPSASESPYYRSLKSSFDFCMVLITVSGVDQEAEVGDDLIQDPIVGTEEDIHAVQREEDLGQGLDQDPVQGLDQDPGIE